MTGLLHRLRRPRIPESIILEATARKSERGTALARAPEDEFTVRIEVPAGFPIAGVRALTRDLDRIMSRSRAEGALTELVERVVPERGKS